MADDFKDRLDRAKKQKSFAERDIHEVMKFCDSGADRDERGNPIHKMCDDEVFDSLYAEAAEDFVSDLVRYYIPEDADWLEYGPGTSVPPELEGQVVQLLQQREARLNEEVAVSNFYDVAPQAFEGAKHGTIAMWSHKTVASRSLIFEVVPYEELYIGLGPYGLLDDRFRQREMKGSHVKTEFGTIEGLDRIVQAKIDNDEKLTVVQGYWRDWSDPAVERWNYELQFDGNTVEIDTFNSVSEVPLHVGRFNPRAGRAWGYGPGRRLLPDIRTHDEVSQMMLEGLERDLDPPIFGPDDGQIDASQGFRSGTFYPVMPGTAQEIQAMPQRSLDASFFTEATYEEKILRGFYQDGPRQRGKTPPTAAQWLDERQAIQRRIGRPAAPLWTEFLKHVIQRVDRSLVERKVLQEKVEIDGEIVTVAPLNPLIKAQRQEDAQIANVILGQIAQYAPDQLPLLVDMPATFTKVKEQLGDEIVQIRSEADMQAMAQQAAAAAQQGGPTDEPV